MTRPRQDRLLSLLVRDGEWVTAATLADALGVTARSIRTYVATVNARVPRGTAIESGPLGYRAGAEAALALRAGGTAEAGTPRERLHTLVRALLAAPAGIDVFDTAERLHVSPATLEADLGRVRGLLGGTGIALERSAATAQLRGTEMAQRRLLSALAHDEVDADAFDFDALRRALGEASVGTTVFGAFKVELVERLGAAGYHVNELGIADVLMHIAIATDRAAQGRILEPADGHAGIDDRGPIAAMIDSLVREHTGVQLGRGDLEHLATLVLTRVVAPGATEQERSRAELDPALAAVVRESVTRAAEQFLIDIAHEDFVRRLALHVQTVRRRAQAEAWSRNPLTRSLKTSYPMIFEVAVFIADDLSEKLGLTLHDDEIGYLAIHVGGQLERNRRRTQMLTATIVCPGYYELPDLLRSSVEGALGGSVEVVAVETRADPDWARIDTDLVLSTIDPPAPSERIVRVQPFLSESDIERVQAAGSRLRRGRRLAQLRTDLDRYFLPGAFSRDLPHLGGEEDVIRTLAAPLLAAGVIDADYVARAIHRERLSSTAFTDVLAVPHAIGMTATRTAISVGISDTSMPWGDTRVQVVALVAFSETDRAAFQTVFEQFVEVFSERESVQRIVRRSVDLPSFLDELAAVIDG